MDVKVQIGAMTLPGPVMPAAGALGNVVELARFGPLAKLGALVPNSLMAQTGAPAPRARFHRAPHGFISSFGANNLSLEDFIAQVLPKLEDAGAPVMVDLKGRDRDDMLALVKCASAQGGIAGVELNLNCPYGEGEPYWKEPATLRRLVADAKAACGKKALVAKAPTGAYPLKAVALACQDGGADAFVSFGGLQGCAVDTQSRTYRCGSGGGGGYSGPGVKPFALTLCRQAAQLLHIPVIGAGGIASGEDALEYLLVGAAAVQVGSACLTRPDAVWRIADELERLLEKQEVADLSAIRGTAHLA